MITTSLSMELHVKVHVEKNNENLIQEIFANNDLLISNQDSISIEQISEQEYSKDYIRLSFQSQAKHPHLNYNIRRRFHDLLDLHSYTEKNPCPVITFYSYKGGVGRTTLLTCYAQYLANKGKQVIIIDCDFEAPGFTNYFGYRFGDESQDEFGNETKSKYGLIEYILDRQFLYPQGRQAIKEKLISRLSSDYSYKVGSEYLNNDKGSIRVVKAGNYETNNLENYLEGLARLDIGNVEVFKEVLEDFKDAFGLEWDNSVVLIDSRTGFNDTFATLYAISNLVVGVFGTNTQSQTGLSYVLDNFLRIEKDKDGNTKPMNKEFLFVQSFNANTSNRDELWDIAEKYFQDNKEQFGLSLDNFNEIPHKRRFYDFPKSYELGLIGENTTSKAKEIELYKQIEEDRLPRTTKFYEVIDVYLKKKIEKSNFDTNHNSLQIDDLQNKNLDFLNEIKTTDIRAERMGENETVQNFYLRSNLKDIFNWDKFIISGSKGTGKTFTYKCMAIVGFQEDLCLMAKENHEQYFFVNTMPILDSVLDDEKYKFFYASRLKEYEETNNFHEKFWTIHTANQIFFKEDVADFVKEKSKNVNFDLSWCFGFTTNSKYAENFWNIINDKQKYSLVEQQLFELNLLLVQNNKKCEYWVRNS